MPNWCYNTATLTASKEQIDALEQELQKKEDANPFQHLRPRPADQEENWYDWNINNWGCKWDITPHDWQREDDTTIVMHFDSPWSPPITLYEFMQENGWTVNALYHEGGMAYIGSYVDGYDDCHEYDITDRDSIEDLPEELVDFGGLMEEHEYWVEENKDETTGIKTV